MSDTRFVIEPDGGIFKETVTKVPIDVLPSLKAAFAQNVTFQIKGFMDFDNPFYGGCGMVANSATPNSLVWSVRVRTINLNCNFLMVDKALVPDFPASKTGSTPMEIPWRVPDDMKVMLGLSVVIRPDLTWTLGKHCLATFDVKGRTWKLPVSNLYNTLELCHGQDTSIHRSALKAIQTALTAFQNSKWNADLYSATNKTGAMFRFEPENSGFKQLPMVLDEGKDWTSLCEKIANEYITTNIIPV